MLVTFDVLKFDRSKAVKDLHFSNIASMLVTFEVSKLDRSSEESDEHSLNI